MIKQETIDLLNTRVGFGYSDPNLVVIEDAVAIGSGVKNLGWYNRLCTTTNLYKTYEVINAEAEEFNSFLVRLREEATAAVLSDVFDKNLSYVLDKDYSLDIEKRVRLFDDALGYALANTCLENMVSSERINKTDRNVDLKYDKLKVEIEGLTDKEGNKIATGVRSKYRNAIVDIVNIFFPDPLTVTDAKFW